MIDRISDLPDAVLCYILSFLPTKESVCTSVLSKRWRPLWASVPVLYFDGKHFPRVEDHSNFVYFVNTVLILRGASAHAPIKKLSLLCHGADFGCNQSDINTWVVAATSNKVEDLTLDLSTNLTLPPCVLKCTTLVVLTINVLWHGHLSGVHLPSLKTLVMRCRRPQYLDCLQMTNLLSCCPVLEDLSLKVTIFAQSSISECQHRFHLNLSKLRKVKLAMNCDHDQDIQISNAKEWICYLVKRLYNARHITLIFPMELLQGAFTNEIPIYDKLTHFKLIIYGAFPWACLIRFLQNCHQLKDLYLFQFADEGLSWKRTPHDPTCVFLRLRKVQFTNYHGTSNELQAVEFFLKNAKNLEKMKIVSAESLDKDPKLKLKILTNLCALRRCSERCMLLFV